MWVLGHFHRRFARLRVRTRAASHSCGAATKKQHYNHTRNHGAYRRVRVPTPRALDGLDVRNFADITGANGAIIRGYTRNPDVARMTACHHPRTACISIRVWVDWDQSQAHIADLPSRPYEPGALFGPSSTWALPCSRLFSYSPRALPARGASYNLCISV